MSLTEISFNNKNELLRAILAHENFSVIDADVAQSVAVEWLEKVIEENGMTCRIYTKYRTGALAALALLATPITAGVSLVVGGIAIGAHRLATRDPDFEIGKGMIGNSIDVTYRKVDKVPSASS